MTTLFSRSVGGRCNRSWLGRLCPKRPEKEIDVDKERYRILGACNPKMAHEAIEIEPHVGARPLTPRD